MLPCSCCSWRPSSTAAAATVADAPGGKAGTCAHRRRPPARAAAATAAAVLRLAGRSGAPAPAPASGQADWSAAGTGLCGSRRHPGGSSSTLRGRTGSVTTHRVRGGAPASRRELLLVWWLCGGLRMPEHSRGPGDGRNTQLAARRCWEARWLRRRLLLAARDLCGPRRPRHALLWRREMAVR